LHGVQKSEAKPGGKGEGDLEKLSGQRDDESGLLEAYTTDNSKMFTFCQ